MFREVFSRICIQVIKSTWDDTRPVPNAVDSELARLVYSRLRFTLLHVRGRLDWSVHSVLHSTTTSFTVASSSVALPPLLSPLPPHHHHHHYHYHHTIAISTSNTSSTTELLPSIPPPLSVTPATWRRREYGLPLTYKLCRLETRHTGMLRWWGIHRTGKDLMTENGTARWRSALALAPVIVICVTPL